MTSCREDSKARAVLRWGLLRGRDVLTKRAGSSTSRAIPPQFPETDCAAMLHCHEKRALPSGT